MSKVHTQIKAAAAAYIQSELPSVLGSDNDFVRAMSERFDRAEKTVRNILAMERQEISPMRLSEPSLDVCVVISDLHYPFHLEPALRNVYRLLEDLQPQTLVLNGDILDCYSISSFEGDPRKPLLADEIKGAKAIIEKFRSIVPHADMHFIEGNHEERLGRLVANNPGLYGLEVLTWPRLLGLPEMGIKYTGYKEHIVIHGDICVTHGHKVSKHAGYSAKAHLLDNGYQNVLHGHTHRMGNYNLTGVSGTRRAYEIGGLYDRKQADYCTNPNWQNGFAVVSSSGGHHQIDLIEINSEDGSFIVGNKIYGGTQ